VSLTVQVGAGSLTWDCQITSIAFDTQQQTNLLQSGAVCMLAAARYVGFVLSLGQQVSQHVEWVTLFKLQLVVC
jgi:hypothetical protein